MTSIQVTNKSKYIDLKYHLIRDYANKGIVKLEYISIEHNVADTTTKALQRVKHSYFTDMLPLCQKI